jgi:hypothetical protein
MAARKTAFAFGAFNPRKDVQMTELVVSAIVPPTMRSGDADAEENKAAWEALSEDPYVEALFKTNYFEFAIPREVVVSKGKDQQDIELRQPRRSERPLDDRSRGTARAEGGPLAGRPNPLAASKLAPALEDYRDGGASDRRPPKAAIAKRAVKVGPPELHMVLGAISDDQKLNLDLRPLGELKRDERSSAVQLSLPPGRVQQCVVELRRPEADKSYALRIEQRGKQHEDGKVVSLGQITVLFVPPFNE